MLPLYENIRKRRQELHYSQEKLADLVGYKGKSMISRIEKGEIDLALDMIHKFADALKTTPGELMGWEEEKDEFDIEFEPEHIELISLYSKLTKEQKNTVLVFLRSLANS